MSKSKWAAGIPPRYFSWVIKGKLAVSERPGGYARNHRKVRRQEEILWLRGAEFSRIVSLLPSPHNLHAYDELGMIWTHLPMPARGEVTPVVAELYPLLKAWLDAGERVLLHQDELDDRLIGLVAGYLRWSGILPSGPGAITVVERIVGRQMGPPGRELVALTPRIPGYSGEAPSL